MVGNTEALIMVTINCYDELDVHYFENEEFVEKEEYAVVGDVCYPFAYYKALQPCSEEQYEAIRGDLH